MANDKITPTQTAAPSSTPDDKLKKLTALVFLQKQARHNRTIPELAFMMTNESFKLLPYRQCIFWTIEHTTGRVKIHTASGLSAIDENAPYLAWLARFVKNKIKATPPESESCILPIIRDEQSEDDQKDWYEWCNRHALLCLFKNNQNEEISAGLWLDREEEFTASDLALLEELSDTYAHAYDRLKRAPQTLNEKLANKLKMSKTRKIILAGVLALMLMPVRQSVTAPVEIVAKDPFIISPRISGAIDDIAITPNSIVTKDQLLATLDDTRAKSEVDIAYKAFLVAQSAYKKASREAFSSKTSKAEIAILQAEMQAKKADYDYAKSLLSYTQITAPIDGTAIFSDPSALRGMPVEAGQRIMQLADPNMTRAQIRIPADAMITINKDVAAKLFLNIAPLQGIKTNITTIGFEPDADPDGLYTYKISAEFPEQEVMPRIGLKGTAKVYGNYTLFAYQMLRRPLIWLRTTIAL